MLDICKLFPPPSPLSIFSFGVPNTKGRRVLTQDHALILIFNRYALAADIQTIPGLPTAPGYLNVDIDTETGEIDGLF